MGLDVLRFYTWAKRYRGYYRRICRRIFDIIGDNYRHIGSGESTFASLTNQYGDRLNTGEQTQQPQEYCEANIQHSKDMDKNNKSNNRIIRHAPAEVTF